MSPFTLALQLAGLVALALGVAALAQVLLTQSSAEAPTFGTRGLKRTRALREEGLFASIDPLVRFTSARLAPFVPDATRREIEESLVRAGDLWGLTADDLISLSVLSGLAGIALGGVYVALLGGGPLFVVLFCVGGLALPRLHVSSTARERVRSIQRALPHSVDLLVLALGAGLDFPAALRQVVEKASNPEAPVIEELGLVLQELKFGRTRQQALEQLAARAPCDAVRDLVAAAVQSDEQGTPLGAVLQTQASTARQRRSTQAEETAAKAGTAMMIPMLLLFVAVLILIVAPIVIEAAPQFGRM